MSDTPLKQLALEWETGNDFLEAFEDGATPTVRATLDGNSVSESGGHYALLLRLKDRDTEFQLRATLARLDSGVATFEFPAESRQRLELVLIGARGESLPYRRRRHTRFPTQFSVRVVDRNGRKQTGVAANFGAGGAHLLLDHPLAVEEQIELAIDLPDEPGFTIVARVTERVCDVPERGNSVEFWFNSAAQRDKVAALADALRRDVQP